MSPSASDPDAGGSDPGQPEADALSAGFPADSSHPVEESPEQRQRREATAWHEAGHAVMAIALGRPVHKVTIVPARQGGGGLRLGACQIRKGRVKPVDDRMEAEVLILLAGMIGESMRTGNLCREGAAQDLRQARRLMEQRADPGRQLERLERRMLDKTVHLLGEAGNALALEWIAAALIERETISGRSAEHLFRMAWQKQA